MLMSLSQTINYGATNVVDIYSQDANALTWGMTEIFPQTCSCWRANPIQ